MNCIEPTIAAIIGLPRQVALLATVAVIFVLFRRDIRERPSVTRALWIPTLWMFFITSRQPTQWARIAGIPIIGGSMEEGNPLDATVFLLLTLAGLYVLNQRRVSLSEFVQNNQWLTIFLIYCFLAIFWSEFPFVSFKRWIKVIGHPIMVLVIFSEPDLMEAVVRLLKRVAYVVLPVSILWIKYYPELGRSADPWGGAMINAGITVGKNALGCISSVFALVFVWHLLRVRQTEKSNSRRNEIRLITFLLLMAGWCLWKAHSATSWISLIAAALVMVFLAFRTLNMRLIGAYAVAAAVVLVIAQLTFDIYGKIVNVSGHESTLESRTRLWEELLKYEDSPVFGVGFESFWLGDRLDQFHETFRWKPIQAHNGYLEAYLNLGIVGLFILIALILATFYKCRHELLRNFDWGRLRMGLLIAIVVHNWTEAGFVGMGFSFLVFFIITIDYAAFEFAPSPASLEATPPEEEKELVYTQEKFYMASRRAI
jgi:exopolysaccharide production protein ExoQ